MRRLEMMYITPSRLSIAQRRPEPEGGRAAASGTAAADLLGRLDPVL